MKTQISKHISLIENGLERELFNDVVEGRTDGNPASFQYDEMVQRVLRCNTTTAGIGIAAIFGKANLHDVTYLYYQFRKEKVEGAMSDLVPLTVTVDDGTDSMILGQFSSFELVGDSILEEVSLTGFSSLDPAQVYTLTLIISFKAP